MRKSEQVLIRLTAKLKRKLRSDADTAGLSMQAYLARLIEFSGANIFPMSFRKLLLEQVRDIGRNINQIAHKVNEGGEVTNDELTAILEMQGEVERLVRNLWVPEKALAFLGERRAPEALSFGACDKTISEGRHDDGGNEDIGTD